jgi:hypothetical protein
MLLRTEGCFSLDEIMHIQFKKVHVSTPQEAKGERDQTTHFNY